MRRLKNLIRRGKEPSPAPSPSTNADPASTCTAESVEPTETSILHEPHGRPQDAGEAREPSTWADLWAEAYETVKDDPEHSHLLAVFEAYLGSDRGSNSDEAPAASEDETIRLGLIQKLAQNKLEGLSEAYLAFSLRGRRIVVRNAVLKAVKLVLSFKPIINGAVAAEPHAALAWAGVLTILPMLENLFQQDEDAANGLTNILFLLIRYQGIQDSILATEFEDTGQPDITRRLLSSIRTKLVSVYAQVYMYQIRFVLQYARSKVHRALRNTVSADGWKQMWSEIESTSRLIDQGVQDRLGVRALKTWRQVNDIEARAERIESLQQATLAAVQTGNEAELLLSLPFAGNAVFDSAETLGANAPCLPGTQRRILSEIQDWAESPNGEAIFWLHGMAGTGKTSVALTVANALDKREPFTAGRTPPSTAFLGASFFFRQGDATRNSTRAFFPTLARCLAEVFPHLKSHIVSSINERLAIGTKAPSQQLKHLIVGPLSVLDKETYLPVRLVVVVDALDECLNRAEAEELLEMLATLEHLHQVQLRLLITSRRDKHLVEGFERLPSILHRSMALDKVQTSTEKNGPTDDITLYLSYTLAKIAEKHGVLQNWIDEADIHKLSQKVDGLFIYAATACRFLDAGDFADEEARQERLEQIFEDDGEVEGPQQKVDEMYLKDICKVIFPAKMVSEVPHRQIEQGIPEHLRYACRYWINHLAKLDQDGDLENELLDSGEIHAFLKERFLFWLEAMSFIGETPMTMAMINKLEAMINPSDSPGLFSFVCDARRFVLANRWVIDHAPLQLYASALIFSPQNSVIRSQFADLMPDWINQKPTTEENWTPLICTLGGQFGSSCVAFSPTEDLVASGSSDGTLMANELQLDLTMGHYK
ncbi:hypothetical protein Neosp_011875 [[Neocosmospora] mangrovei]